MKRVPVDSTAIASVGYDAKRQILEIEFASGGVYRYRDVPAPIYRSFLRATSKGQFFQEYIRDEFEFNAVDA